MMIQPNRQHMLPNSMNAPQILAAGNRAKPVLQSLGLATTLIVLGGCDTFSSVFGLARTAPDEFAVVTQAPLVIPPEYKLRPPAPGTLRPQQLTPQADAQRALFERTLAEGTKSSIEQQVLTKAQVERANPEIKQVVARETTAVVPKDEGLVDQLMFWKSSTPEKPQEVVVDPGQESKRLTEAQLIGAKATDGKTPTAKDEKPGFFGRMFDWIF